MNTVKFTNLSFPTSTVAAAANAELGEGQALIGTDVMLYAVFSCWSSTLAEAFSPVNFEEALDVSVVTFDESTGEVSIASGPNSWSATPRNKDMAKRFFDLCTNGMECEIADADHVIDITEEFGMLQENSPSESKWVNRMDAIESVMFPDE